jgi:hypothetical protein
MITTPPMSPPMNHVLVDFENVHHIDPAIIGAKSVSLTILVGAKQTKLDAETVVKLFEHAASVQLIRLTASDKNAVDFALAYYLGRAVLSDPTAYFHIVSKDSGYDPLVAHLASRHVRVRRHKDFSTLTFAAPSSSAAAAPKPVAKPKPAMAAPKKEAIELTDTCASSSSACARARTTARRSRRPCSAISRTASPTAPRRPMPPGCWRDSSRPAMCASMTRPTSPTTCKGKPSMAGSIVSSGQRGLADSSDSDE